ncbi:MAG: hypothetical protein IJQ99_05490 [Synergistaceae bacterium]|nr:hypothetical protein [Synergistaceae bacterium]
MPKKLITKRISDLTETDKAQYLSYIKESFSTNYNTDWSSLEPHIQATIDTIFDDELFADFVTQETVRDSNSPRGENHRVNPRVRAAMQAREYFHYKKPSLVDYLIFGKVLESGESRESGSDTISWWVNIPSAHSTHSTQSAATLASSASKTAIIDQNTSVGGEGKKSGRASGRAAVCASLSPADKDLFYNTFFPLIDFVNKRHKIVKGVKGLDVLDSISPMAIKEIVSKLWANPSEEINAYLAKHPELNQEEKSIILGFKWCIHGRFIIERYLKSGAIFIHIVTPAHITTEDTHSSGAATKTTAKATAEAGNKSGNMIGDVYLVKGLSASFEDMFWDKPLPLMIDATLLPFRGMIVTDGLFAPYGLIFGKSVRNAFKDVYMKAKKNKTVFTRL